DQGNAEREEIHRARLVAILQHCPRLVQMWFHEREVNYAELSPDGLRALTASEDGTACVWDVFTGKLLIVLKHTGPVKRAVFSPDGRLILTAGEGDVAGASIWDAAEGRRLFGLKHPTLVAHAAFSRDGKLVVTSGY